MSEKQVIMVTGVGGHWGAEVASRLIGESQEKEPPGPHIIGLDSEPPEREITGLDFIQADIRNPLLVNLLASENVHTVCHLVFEESVPRSEAEEHEECQAVKRLATPTCWAIVGTTQRHWC